MKPIEMCTFYLDFLQSSLDMVVLCAKFNFLGCCHCYRIQAISMASAGSHSNCWWRMAGWHLCLQPTCEHPAKIRNKYGLPWADVACVTVFSMQLTRHCWSLSIHRNNNNNKSTSWLSDKKAKTLNLNVCWPELTADCGQPHKNKNSKVNGFSIGFLVYDSNVISLWWVCERLSIRTKIKKDVSKARLRSTNSEVCNNYKSFETECLAILNVDV